MKTWTIAALPLLLVTGAMPAGAQTLAPGLAGLSFMVGEWGAGTGVVADMGGTSTGRSTITAEAGGAVLLRRDHTDLFDKAGKAAGGFEQIMMIYAEAGTVHADYSDGSHVIHYDRAEIEPDKAVTFTSRAAPGQPVFRLRYTRATGNRLAISFAMAPPGSSAFQPIADGTLVKIR